jgi:hypothetical protein
MLSLLVIAFTSKERTRGLLSTTVTWVISLLMGNIGALRNAKVQPTKKVAKANGGIKRIARAVNRFLWYLQYRLMIPTIPTVSKTIPPNPNQSPRFGDLGDKSVKMLRASAPSK